jgi:uncharacterized protein with PQ loop repeat
MHAVFSLLPLVAAILAVPQFLPQLARLARTGETAGVSWSWAALTSINNAAWAGYFALSGFWTALVAAISATVLAGALAVMLARRGAGFPRRPAALALAWTALLITAASLFGRAGLGTALTVAFLLQVTPSVWTAYRADHTTGIAKGTWLLIFGELLCWGVFGIYESDPRLIVLGATGVTASLLVLARVARPRAPQNRRQSGYPASPAVMSASMPSRMRSRPKMNSSSGPSATSKTPAAMNAVSAGKRCGSVSCLSMRG